MSKSISLFVKHGASTVEVAMPGDADVRELQAQLETRTGVFVRHQKLIFKGKVLDASSSLSACRLPNGAKVLLLVAQGGAGGAPTKARACMQACEDRRMGHIAC